MRFGRILMLAAAVLLLAGTLTSAFIPGPGNGVTSLNPYTGAVNISGNRTNGSDSIANVNVNGQINVRSYGAKGDGATDDTAAIQAAINASCASSVRPPVYLPPTPSASYLISSPILQNCAMALSGPSQTANIGGAIITQNYLGPTILMEANDTGWKPPLASSISLAWAPSTTYAQWKEILDSNGNVEVQTGASCTSGSGTHPTWPTAQPNTVADNTCTWEFAMTGTQLATGTGTALDAVSRELWPGAGYGNNNAGIDLGRWGGVNDAMLNGLSAFTWEFFVNDLQNTSASGTVSIGPQIKTQQPNLQSDPIYIYEADAQGTCPHNCVAAILFIGGARIALQPITANAQATAGVTHNVAVSCGAGTCGLYLDGVQLKTATFTGGLSYYPYSQSFTADPSQSTTGAIAYYDSFRISNSARYTANYTPSTAKFASDGNTLFLENYPTNAPVGTLQGTNVSKNKTTYLPVETSAGAAEVNPGYLGNLQISGGVDAFWAVNSTIENMSQFNGSPICLELQDNDFQVRVNNFYCSVVPSVTPTTIGFYFGNQANNNYYYHLQCDGQQTCIEMQTGSGYIINADYSGRGQAFYQIALIQTQAEIDGSWLDIEDAEPNNLAAIYLNGNYAPTIINSGQYSTGNTAGAEVAISGGKGAIITGVDFGGAIPAEQVKVIAAPTSPITIRDSILKTAPRADTLANGQYVSIVNGNRPEQVTNANLWPCSANNEGEGVLVTDNDAACSFGGAPAHSTCTLGTNCFACPTQCQVSGANVFAWKEY